MKKIFRKNQLVITALALMIAVAGYFSYMNNNMEDGQVTAEASADAGTVQDTYDISEEDMLAEQEIFTDEGTGEELALVEGTETAAVDAAQSGDVAQMTDGAADVENPGGGAYKHDDCEPRLCGGDEIKPRADPLQE